MSNMIQTSESKKKAESEAEIVNELLQFVNDKYPNYQFEEVLFQRKGFWYGYDRLTLKTKVKDEEVTFYVTRRVSDSGEAEIEDNFFGYIIKSEYDNMINKIISDSFDTYHLRSDLGSIYYPNSLTASSNIEELLAKKNDIGETLLVTVYIKQTDQQDSIKSKLQECFERLRKQDIHTIYTFKYIKSKDYLQFESSGFDVNCLNSNATIEEVELRSE